MVSTSFTELNGLRRNADNVFCKDGSVPFDYSDGAEAEQRLAQVLATASDLSSASPELVLAIDDWPTEYHLSPLRANLLRGLNLHGVRTVLELGCGCGAISRYLGEQPGMQIDSIEGSPVRARLAAMRCRDLPNVTISTGNFNEMAYPDSHYDLVLFVGVTEYAGRFSDCETDQQALQDLLALARRTVSSNGCAMIAIENRTGLKYMMGASEDHYGVPYMGIDNYPKSTGIRTYTRAEWQSELSQSGFTAARYIYPFPDYKVPTLLVDQDCTSANPKLNSALAKIRSRDYAAPFDLGDREARLWQAVLEAGTLGEHANSFMILLGDDEQQLNKLVKSELQEYSPAPVSGRSKDGQADEARHQALADQSSDPELAQRQETQNLSEQVLALRLHADNLQHEIDLMTKSRGWKFLNKIRAILGKPTVSR